MSSDDLNNSTPDMVTPADENPVYAMAETPPEKIRRRDHLVNACLFTFALSLMQQGINSSNQTTPYQPPELAQPPTTMPEPTLKSGFHPLICEVACELHKRRLSDRDQKPAKAYAPKP